MNPKESYNSLSVNSSLGTKHVTISPTIVGESGSGLSVTQLAEHVSGTEAGDGDQQKEIHLRDLTQGNYFVISVSKSPMEEKTPTSPEITRVVAPCSVGVTKQCVDTIRHLISCKRGPRVLALYEIRNGSNLWKSKKDLKAFVKKKGHCKQFLSSVLKSTRLPSLKTCKDQESWDAYMDWNRDCVYLCKRYEPISKKVKYFICVRCGSGRTIENELAVYNQSPIGEPPGFILNDYLKMERRACKIALRNANRVACHVAQLCNLDVASVFERHGHVGNIKLQSGFSPVLTAVPRFAQFSDRTMVLSPQNQEWIVSHHGACDMSETRLRNGGRAVVFVPKSQVLISMPLGVSTAGTMIPESLDSREDIETYKKDFGSVHIDDKEIKDYKLAIQAKALVGSDIFNNVLGERVQPTASLGVERPLCLKTYKLYSF